MLTGLLCGHTTLILYTRDAEVLSTITIQGLPSFNRMIWPIKVTTLPEKSLLCCSQLWACAPAYSSQITGNRSHNTYIHTGCHPQPYIFPADQPWCMALTDWWDGEGGRTYRIRGPRQNPAPVSSLDVTHFWSEMLREPKQGSHLPVRPIRMPPQYTVQFVGLDWPYTSS